MNHVHNIWGVGYKCYNGLENNNSFSKIFNEMSTYSMYNNNIKVVNKQSLLGLFY